MDDILELPPGLRAPDGWNESHWVRLDLPSGSRPLSDDEWRNYVLVVSGCERGEMEMPTYGLSMRVFVFFSDPYYAEKILVTAAGLKGGPKLKPRLPPEAYKIKARGHGFELDDRKSSELIVSGIRSGYTLGDLFDIFRFHGFIFSIAFRPRNKGERTESIAVRFFDIELYNHFVLRPPLQAAKEMVDPTCVVIRGVPTREDFELVARFLEREHGRLVVTRFLGDDKRSRKGGEPSVTGWIRFGHPDKAKAAFNHKFGKEKYPNLRLLDMAPLWTKGIPPPGAFKGEIGSWRGGVTQQDGAFPHQAITQQYGIPLQHETSLVPLPPGASATSLPPGTAVNMWQTIPAAPSIPNVRLPQPSVMPHPERNPWPSASSALASSSSSSAKTRPTKPKRKKNKKSTREPLPQQPSIETTPMTITSSRSTTAEHRRWGRDPSQEPLPLGGSDHPSVPTQTTKSARTRSKERQFPTHVDGPRPSDEVTALSAEEFGNAVDPVPLKSTVTNESRIREGALDDRDKFIIRWFQHDFPLEYSKIKDDLTGCLLRDQVQRFNTTLKDDTMKSIPSKRERSDHSDEPQFWRFEGNNRDTLKELGLRMEEKTAKRRRQDDLRRLDQIFEVEQRWMHELSRRNTPFRPGSNSGQ